MRFGPRSTVPGALACFAVLALIGLLAHLSNPAMTLDADLLEAATERTGPRVDRWLVGYVHLGDPAPYLLVSTAIVVTAWARGTARLALVLAAVLVLAPLTAEILKLLTAQTRLHSATFAHHISRASWPSGHTTAATTAAICAVLVAPPSRRRALAAIGALYALGMGFSVVALAWHFPSDVLGAYVLSAGWCLLALRAAGLPQRL
jgi:membrane-associated phospholipid phosphatase